MMVDTENGQWTGDPGIEHTWIVLHVSSAVG
jgi:hypothetical protein